jgi:hypothetical protein
MYMDIRCRYSKTAIHIPQNALELKNIGSRWFRSVSITGLCVIQVIRSNVDIIVYNFSLRLLDLILEKYMRAKMLAAAPNIRQKQRIDPHNLSTSCISVLEKFTVLFGKRAV